MSDPLVFCLAVFGLLATPGPTNSLLAAAGALSGWRASLRLVGVELAAYALSIGALSLLLGPVLAEHAVVTTGLKVAAAVWLLWCALRFWTKGAERGGDGMVSGGRVFATTLLNPKAAIFAFVIFPPGQFFAWFPVFALVSLPVALLWLHLGDRLAGWAGGWATPARIGRIAALAHLVFALAIARDIIVA